MTTVLADSRLGLMVSDTNFGDDDTRGQMRKVWRIRGGLVGLAGNLDEFAPFLLWLKDGMEGKPPRVSNLAALWLQPTGILWFSGSVSPIVVQGRSQAIGTGAKAALAAHEAMDYADPKRAVKIACNHDSASRTPVRAYRL
jgi:hypothetical protein